MLAQSIDSGLGSVVQLVMQGGALGLLTVIVWQIPKILGALKEWRETTEKAHREERDATLRAYREETRYEREACKEHFDRLADLGTANQMTTHQALDRLSQAVDRVGDAVNTHDALARHAMSQIDQIHRGKTPP